MNARGTITAAVLARDEEADIGPCLDALAWADECLVVVDAATRDRTREVARRHGARVEDWTFRTFAAQRDRALELARGDWVLFVDADERVRQPLRDEVLAAIARESGVVGYWIPRENVIAGRVLRGGGWFPDQQLRLLKRGRARFDPRYPVHEIPLLDGPTAQLMSPFLHFNFRSLRDVVRKQERYVTLDAEAWIQQHGRPRLRAVVGQPLRTFARRYVGLRGYRDGPVGLALALITAWYAGKAVWRARRS
ncbi:MAG: glycosyltransferase family 2 protein [Chloroflexi bacterium]|nr:glycosyltransferase family 2 protein [Chloroflexota bacterium]